MRGSSPVAVYPFGPHDSEFHLPQDEMLRRLQNIRQDVRDTMVGCERSLVEDIEIAGATAAMHATLPAPPSYVPTPSPRAGASHNTCEVCGRHRDEAPFCPLTGRPHRVVPTEFDRTRNLLLRERTHARDEGTQTHVPPDHMVAKNAYGGTLQVGGFCLVRPEWEVRRACVSGTPCWDDRMARYCGGRAVGRVVFAKGGCSTADVLFPDGEAWLFPVAVLQPYHPPEGLEDMERYPLPDTDDNLDDEFIMGLQGRLREKELIAKANRLQMDCVERFIDIYRDEMRSRQKLRVAFHELLQISQLEAGALALPPKVAPYPTSQRRRGPARGSSAPTTPHHSSYPSFSPVAPALPPQQSHSEIPRTSHTTGSHPTDRWEVVGVTPDGHYVYREGPPPSPARNTGSLSYHQLQDREGLL